MKVDLFDLMAEALKSERDINLVKKIEVKLPVLERAPRIANLKWEREGRFKKLTDQDLWLDPNEGFFFHYNQKDNIFATSNASFSFLVNIGPRRKEISGGRRIKTRSGTTASGHAKYYYHTTAPYYHYSPHKFNKTADEESKEKELGHGEINFRVMTRNRKVNMERIWEGNRISANTIDDPIAFQDALRAAIKFFPHVADYTFKDKTMKVSEWTKTGPEALEAGGEHEVFLPVKGDDAKEIMKTGDIDGKVTFELKLARDKAKNLHSDDMYGVWAILGVETKGTEGFGEQAWQEFPFKKHVDPSRIRLVKTNFKAYFEPKFKKPALLDLGNWPWYKEKIRYEKFIFIAADEEQYKYFTETRRARERYTKAGKLKGGQTLDKYSGMEYVVRVLLDIGANVIIFKPETTRRELDKFFAYNWLLGFWSINSLLPYNFKYDHQADAAYEMIYNRNFNLVEDRPTRGEENFAHKLIAYAWKPNSKNDVEEFLKIPNPNNK